jgi:ribulose-bisphosphate carboxylase large chain
VISFDIESAGADLVQLLNVLFGNISLKPGIRLERLDLPNSLLEQFKGPRFGREGLRARLGVYDRPLLCTALKPMGMSPAETAGLACRLALGGIQIVKDDHGLADQRFCPFEERVSRCAEAVERASRETGLKSIYMPNLSGPTDRVLERAGYAQRAGAGGVLISPGLTGLDAMRQIAEDDLIGLPIMAHPAFQGSFVVNPGEGISHAALFGQINRLAGADAVIFPNYGGRFGFTRADCRSLTMATAMEMGHLKPIFPTPAGGMSLERVPEMCEMYGCDAIFLIGGGLLKHGPDLVENCRGSSVFNHQSLITNSSTPPRPVRSSFQISPPRPARPQRTSSPFHNASRAASSRG